MIALPPLIDAAREDWALFLDVDGTLIEIADSPEAVVVEPGLTGLLNALAHRLGGALALVSGRRLEAIDSLFAPLRLPAAGLHGAQRRDVSGRISLPEPAPELARLRPELAAFAAGHPGLMLEDKDFALALHYRQAPELEDTARARAVTLAGETKGALHLIDGKMVLEFRPAGWDKGGAIDSFLEDAPFHGRRPVFIGDDTTDEDGFIAVNALGGLSIRVGPQPSPTRPTHARYRLDSVAAVHGWLAALNDRLAAAPGRIPANVVG